MKLVDILANSLKEWPLYDCVRITCIVQDPDQTMYVNYNCEPAPYTRQGEWVEVWWDDSVSNLSVDLAEDHATAMVTEEMWMEAKLALQANPKNTEEIKVKEVIDTNSTEYKISVMQAYLDGKQIEYREDGWHECNNPVWNWAETPYRIKPQVRTPPSIPWNVIEDKYKYFAVDDDCEYGYLYTESPCEEVGYWSNPGPFDCEQLTGIKWERGNLPWNETLIKRPDGV